MFCRLLTLDPGYLDATATEAKTAGPRLVAPCSLRLEWRFKSITALPNQPSATSVALLDARSLIHCLFQLVTRLRNTVRDSIRDALLPDVLIVDQRPVPEDEGRSDPITVYFNLWRNNWLNPVVLNVVQLLERWLTSLLNVTSATRLRGDCSSREDRTFWMASWML